MHNLKTQYFKSSGKWYMDEGYHGVNSRLQIEDKLFDNLDDMSKYHRRSDVYEKAMKVLSESGLKYLVILDDDYLGYPMLVINGEAENW